jgi:hypothetical protein
MKNPWTPDLTIAQTLASFCFGEEKIFLVGLTSMLICAENKIQPHTSQRT